MSYYFKINWFDLIWYFKVQMKVTLSQHLRSLFMKFTLTCCTVRTDNSYKLRVGEKIVIFPSTKWLAEKVRLGLSPVCRSASAFHSAIELQQWVLESGGPADWLDTSTGHWTRPWTTHTHADTHSVTRDSIQYISGSLETSQRQRRIFSSRRDTHAVVADQSTYSAAHAVMIRRDNTRHEFVFARNQQSVASLQGAGGGGPPRVTLFRGWHPKEKNCGQIYKE